MSDDPAVEVLADPDALATTVARTFLDLVGRPVPPGRSGGVHEIVLTGGSIADKIHREIARLAPGCGVDWSRVRFWWGDERFVVADSAERNDRQARAAFLDALPVPSDNIMEVPATGSVRDVRAGAEVYADLIRSAGTGEFDLVMLGVGPDGHVASLFPGHRALDVDDRVTTWVEDSPKPPSQRITLTFGALNRSRAVWFLVSGADKAGAVAAALAGGDPHTTPARGVTGREETVWFLDASAAQEFDQRSHRQL